MKISTPSAPVPKARERFAHNLRMLRRLRDISQEQLAHEAGISRAYLGDVERANRAVTIDVMEKLALALGVELVVLLSDNALLFLNEENHQG